MNENFFALMQELAASGDIEGLMEQFDNWLDMLQYTVKRATGDNEIPMYLTTRYTNIPADFISILSRFDEIENGAGTLFFLTYPYFEGTIESAFTYDTFEALSLENTVDEEQRKSVIAFWNTHIPFLISLHNGYEFYAVSTIDGTVVHGCEPDFESVSAKADSMADFIVRVILGKIIL